MKMYTEMEGESKYHVANILSSMANAGDASVRVLTTVSMRSYIICRHLTFFSCFSYEIHN